MHMMATDAAMLYKLMILYMLDKAGFSLTNSQITDFILSRGYTNYFSVQQSLSDLEETGLIETEKAGNTTFYRLGQNGIDTLKAFGQRIPETIREDMDGFFSSKKYELMDENEITADYHKISWDCYEVTCEIREKDNVIAAVKLTVSDESEAITMCRRWQQYHQEVYNYLMTRMIAGEE